MAGLLTADRGNSTLDLYWHGEEPLRQRFDPEDLPRLRAALTARPPTRVVACSVVSDGLVVLREALPDRDLPWALAGVDLPCPLESRYSDPSQLGADRWLGALAAHRQFGAALVVDCGTACTFNLVDAAGVFLGGAIAPGPQTMAAGLAAAAPALPKAQPQRRAARPAQDSQASVDLGVGAGFRALVDGLAAELVEAAGVDGMTWLMTGGGAGVYRDQGGVAFRMAPDLVHQGLAQLDRA